MSATCFRDSANVDTPRSLPNRLPSANSMRGFKEMSTDKYVLNIGIVVEFQIRITVQRHFIVFAIQAQHIQQHVHRHAQINDSLDLLVHLQQEFTRENL